eukprot:6287845-Pyramimonas_sp.AAC.1
MTGGVANCLDPPPPKVKKTPAPGQQVDSDGGKAGGDSAAQPIELYQHRQPKMVRAIEYDMTEFFESCVTLYAQLTDTDPATYPAAGTPFGP